MSRKIRRVASVAFIIISVIMLLTVLALNTRSSRQAQAILEESIKAQLISISSAARALVDGEAFESYNSEEVAALPEYIQTLEALRTLKDNVGAEYIYALKEMDGKYYFVFDTDEEDSAIFVEYELSPVHESAFSGLESADVMNVVDEYGSFHTGAVPIYAENNKIVGIISADIEDTLLNRERQNVMVNTILLFASVLITVAGMGLMLYITFRKMSKLQASLERMAKYDKLTSLPNRQFLLEKLDELTHLKKPIPFALLFIDLDNFKQVNDHAGHDAGDNLLVNIAAFLDNLQEDATVFRPNSGKLNVAARIGGDEFIMIAAGIDTEEKAAAFTQNLLDAFEHEKVDRYIEKYAVGFSIGVALYPHHSKDYNVLIKYADIAMYHAKRGGKNNYMVYSEAMTQKDEK